MNFAPPPMGFPGQPGIPLQPPPQPDMPAQPLEFKAPEVVLEPPNNTVYVKNLNEKINMTELKKSLYHVFSPHGKILELHAQKLNKLRGQAWIIYEDEASAVKAVETMANYSFYGKPMRVNFAKVKSDLISKKDGTFVQRPKRKTKKPEPKKVKRKKVLKAAPTEDVKMSEDSTQPSVSSSSSSSSVIPTGESPPNNILFIENLPVQCNAVMLEMLFQQYEGYKEARLVEGKPGIAFIEFTGVPQSTRAKDTLQGFSITPTDQMKITFAKR